MAGLISNGNVNLSGASAFYEVEAFNAGFASGTVLALTSTRTISMTPLHAVNGLGVVIGLSYSSTTAFPDRDVTCTLKQSGTTRASATLTAAQITGMASGDGSGNYITAFTFSAPYAVTTSAGVWTIDITQGSGSNNWNVVTSNGTAVSYAFWGDTAKTFSSTNDWIICKDRVTVDATATLKGAALATGDTTRSIAALICSGSTVTTADVDNLRWGTGGSYTLTCDGNIVLGSHGGFRAGTSTGSPITVTNAGTLYFQTPTLGTLSSFYGLGVVKRKQSIIVYGEIPAVERTYLNGNFISVSTITTTTSTGWKNGDSIQITGATSADTTPKTMTADASGTSISFTSALSASTRYSGWAVYRYNGYGFKITHQTQQDASMGIMSNFVLSGVQVERTRFSIADTVGLTGSDVAGNTSARLVSHCSWLNTASHMFSTIYVDDLQMKIEYVNGTNTNVYNIIQQTNNGSVLIDNCCIGQTNNAGASATSIGLAPIHLTNNQFSALAYGIFTAQNFNFTSNKFMLATSGTIISLAGCFSSIDWSGNTWDGGATSGISLTASNVNLYMNGDVWNGTVGTITNAFVPSANTYQYIRTYNLTGSPAVSTSGMATVIDGSRIWFEKYNGVTNQDINYSRRGIAYRTGYGIADTNVLSGDSASLVNAGSTTTNYGEKIEAFSGSTVMRYRRRDANAPFTRVTGDATGKQITVTARVYIPHADYYGGTYTLPTLSVVDNDGTTRTAVASAAAGLQTLQVSWAPATSGSTYTYELYGASDAAGTTTINGITVNKKAFYVVYLDAGTYAGGSVDNTKEQIWLQGQVQNAESTIPTPSSVWEVPKSVASATANSIGQVVQDTNGLVSV